MGKLELVTGTAPSHWASYLINGDDSGLEADDIKAASAFVNWLGACPVDCADAGFIWRHDAWNFMPLGADCALYSALVAA